MKRILLIACLLVGLFFFCTEFIIDTKAPDLPKLKWTSLLKEQLPLPVYNAFINHRSNGSPLVVALDKDIDTNLQLTTLTKFYKTFYIVTLNRKTYLFDKADYKPPFVAFNHKLYYATLVLENAHSDQVRAVRGVHVASLPQ